MLILFTGCSKDDEVTLTGPESDLIGLWTISENNVSVEAFVGDQTIIEYLVSVGGITEEEAELIYVQYQDENLSEFDFSGTIEFKSDKTYISISPPDDQDDGTWKLSSDGKTLTLDEGDPDYEEVLTINSLSSSSMSITIIEEDFDDMGDDYVDIVLTLTFTK